MILPSSVAGRWYEAPCDQLALPSAIDGHTVATVSSSGSNFAERVNYAGTAGGRELRKLTFHRRAAMLRALALYIDERREALDELSYETGAARRARRELPDEAVATYELPTMNATNAAALTQAI